MPLIMIINVINLPQVYAIIFIILYMKNIDKENQTCE